MAYLEFEFDSKTLKRQVSFEAIIPYENFEGPYPTLYLLHGLGANESLARALKEAGADVIYQPRPGGHTAIFCNENLPDVFAFLNPQTKARD